MQGKLNYNVIMIIHNDDVLSIFGIFYQPAQKNQEIIQRGGGTTILHGVTLDDANSFMNLHCNPIC